MIELVCLKNGEDNDIVRYLVGANIFFACVHGPYKKHVEQRLIIFPREYIVAKGTGFPRSN